MLHGGERDEKDPTVAEPTAKIAAFFRNDSMSIALFSLFAICLAGQSLTGWSAYNQSLSDAHYAAIGYAAYLSTGQFLDGAISNWQAAVLQLAVLIAFASVLRQKGAVHSRQLEETGSPRSVRTVEWKFTPRRSVSEWLYANSLSIAFAATFLACFAAHAVFGTRKHNEDQMLRHLPSDSIAAYVKSADFWFTVFQTWEAEFLAIGVYIVLSIFLRQEGSAESKPVGASNRQTGGANE